MAEPSHSSYAFFWPWLAAATASEAAVNAMDEFARRASKGDQAPGVKPCWTTSHRVALELPTGRLLDFSTRRHGAPLLICAPFALHTATIADFAPHHSLVRRLRENGHSRVFVTDWRSSSPEMRYYGIDNYLADLNVILDEIQEPVDLVGLCQGGWMSLLLAARFPGKVRRLVLAGAPIDLGAGRSRLSRLANTLPMATFRELVHQGRGRVLGQRLLKLWTQAPTLEDIRAILQRSESIHTKPSRLEERFRNWHAWTVDLPGTYYLQVVEWLFKENRIVEGLFVALGKRIDLSKLTTPLYLLAARDDDIIAPEQLFALGRNVGTPSHLVEKRLAPGGHLALFMGAETLNTVWGDIADWLSSKE